jgi:dCTP deaminase
MLSRNAIQALMEAGLIRIEPEPARIGPNSVDLRLGPKLFVYHRTEGRVLVQDPLDGGSYYALDPKNPPPLVEVPKTPDGRWLLIPGQFYLGSTLEETFTRGVVPHLDGRSTCGRLSIEAHKTAGVGDNGYKGRWTVEIEASEPVLVASGDRLFQMYFAPCWGAGLATVIRVTDDGTKASCQVNKQDPLFVDLLATKGASEHTRVTSTDPLLELKDLYGDEKSHYQGAQGVAGAAPLD